MVGGSTGPAGKWYDDDRAFQSHLQSQKVVGGADGDATRSSLDLSEVETFAYSAVADAVASCDQYDANLNLKVARAFLSQSRRELAGRRGMIGTAGYHERSSRAKQVLRAIGAT